MAEILINSIQFIQNNQYGTFVSGDVLTIYYDDTELVSNNTFNSYNFTGIHTYKNGTEIFTGPLINISPYYASVTSFITKTCLDTDQVLFAFYGGWPYFSYYTVPNASECAASPIVCDLIIVGNPLLLEPTDELTADGEIEITATSTNAIQYKLNDDFVYGQGQASGLFTGLLYGKYRIYVRDSKNCSANIYVDLTSQHSYGALYVLTYFDFAGFETKIEIAERDYTAGFTEVIGSDSPISLQLRGEGESDKFTPIISITSEVQLLSETDLQFADLYTNDPNKYRINYYKDTGSGFQLKLVTKLLPFLYSEEYKLLPYLQVIGSDGLAELKDYSFVQKDGLRFYGKMKLIKIIAYCLSFTRLNLNIKVGCNIYSTAMTQTAASDPLDQAYADTEVFYLSGSNTLDQVIKTILEPFGATLKQWDGYWNIIRVEEQIGNYDYRIFDTNGDYVSNSSFSPVIDVDFPSAGGVNFIATPNMELKNGYGKVEVNYNLGLKDNILRNGDFSVVSRYDFLSQKYVDVINLEGWTLVDSGYPLRLGAVTLENENVALSLYNLSPTLYNIGKAYLLSSTYSLKMGVGNSLKIMLRVKCEVPLNMNAPYVKIRFTVQNGSQYLNNDGYWGADVYIISRNITEYDKFIDIDMIAFWGGESGATSNDFSFKLYHAHAYFTDFVSLTTLRATPVATLAAGTKTEYSDGSNPVINSEYIYYYELTEIDEAETGFDIVEPVDYNASTNPFKWVLKTRIPVYDQGVTFSVDYIKTQFLTAGKEPIKTITRVQTAEPRNKLKLSKELFIGSSAPIIVTETGFFFDYAFSPVYGDSVNLNKITTSLLSCELAYCGWLRSSSNVAYDNWTRDGKAESDLLHLIWLKMTAAQYNRSWRLLRANIVSNTTNMGFLNTFREVNDNNRIYYPISGTINDKANTFDGELLEIGSSVAGDTLGTTREHTSAFSNAYS